MTQYTENYRLELYEGTDKADLTDQYNVSMGILDGAMKGVVDDTDASVAGIRADLATTNSNLNATNVNLQALDAREAEHHTALTAADTQLQGEIDTLKTTVDAVPETYATQEALAAVKTEVDKNTPLVEEHVNYFAQLGVTDEESATALHTEIDNAFQGTMSNTTAIEEMWAQLSPWKQFGTVTIKNKNWPFYSCGTFACIHINGRLDLGSITGGTIHNEPFNLPSGFHLPASWNTTPHTPVLIFDGSPKADVAFARISISQGSVMLGITTTKDYTSAYLLASTMIVFPVTSEPPSGGDNPEPPQEPITFAAYPGLSSANGGVGTTNAKFSGSVDEAGKLVMSNVNAFYNFTSALGSDEVSLPTRKIVIANIASSDVVQVPTSVRVYSVALSGSQTYPVSYANGELSFTTTADNNSLGSHTGVASSKTLILSAYYSYDTAPNPPTTTPEDPKLNGIYPITLSGSRKPGSSNANEPFEISGTITYNEGVVSAVTLNQGSGVLCVLKSDNPAYATALVEVSELEITGEHVPDTLTFEAQLFQDNVRATQAVEFTKTRKKLFADNFNLIGNLQAAQNGFGQARLSFMPR